MGFSTYELMGLDEELLKAAERGDADRARELSRRGTNLNTRDDFRGYADVVRLLLDRGSDVDARNNDGKAPLDLAREKEHVVAGTPRYWFRFVASIILTTSSALIVFILLYPVLFSQLSSLVKGQIIVTDISQIAKAGPSLEHYEKDVSDARFISDTDLFGIMLIIIWFGGIFIFLLIASRLAMNSELLKAAEKGDVRRVKKLLDEWEEGVDDWTPLINANINAKTRMAGLHCTLRLLMVTLMLPGCFSIEEQM